MGSPEWMLNCILAWCKHNEQTIEAKMLRELAVNLQSAQSSIHTLTRRVKDKEDELGKYRVQDRALFKVMVKYRKLFEETNRDCISLTERLKDAVIRLHEAEAELKEANAILASWGGT